MGIWETLFHIIVEYINTCYTNITWLHLQGIVWWKIIIISWMNIFCKFILNWVSGHDKSFNCLKSIFSIANCSLFWWVNLLSLKDQPCCSCLNRRISMSYILCSISCLYLSLSLSHSFSLFDVICIYVSCMNSTSVSLSWHYQMVLSNFVVT